MSLTHLIPAITDVLTAPGVDLTRISAKTVRKSILAADASLDPEFVRSNKEGIDNLIKEIFSTVSASKQADGQYQVDQESQDEDRKGHSNKSQPPHPAQSSAAENAARDDDNRADTPHSKQELDDEEYARRVSAEINAGARGRTTRGSSANGAVSSASAAKRRKYAKSKVKSPSKIIDSDASASEGPDGYDDNDDEDGGDSRSKKKGVKRRRTKGDSDGGGAKGGFGKEFLLSEPLSAVCEGAIQLSRPQVVKALWKYIKGNQLQNPRNKREILCDEKLRDIFKSTRINMFTMNKELGAHLYDPNDAS